MKPSYFFLLLLIAPLASSGVAQTMQPVAQGQNEASSKPPAKRTSSSSGNTASGGDPADESLRRGQQYLDAIVAGPSDAKRWAIPIFSDSEDPKELESYLIKSADFRLRLLAEKGHIQFVKGAAIDIFKIGLPPSSNNSTCRGFMLNAVHASATHAVIRKLCYEVEYRPGRFRAEVSYFLYDRITHSMRTLWESYSSIKDAPSPAPNTKPAISILPSGYELRWNGSYVFEGERKKLAVHNRYTWETRGDGTTSLICRDLSQAGKVEPETGACEGGYLPLVSSTTVVNEGRP